MEKFTGLLAVEAMVDAGMSITGTIQHAQSRSLNLACCHLLTLVAFHFPPRRLQASPTPHSTSLNLEA